MSWPDQGLVKVRQIQQLPVSRSDGNGWVTLTSSGEARTHLGRQQGETTWTWSGLRDTLTLTKPMQVIE